VKRPILLAAAFWLLVPAGAWAESATLAADAYVSAASPASNYGKRKQLWVQGPAAGETAQSAYLLFDLSSLPFGTVGSDVAKATLVLGVGKVRSAGSFDVVRVVGAGAGEWSESVLSAANAPSLSSTPEVAGVAVAGGDKSSFKALDLTPLVRDWLDGALPNNGVALVPNGSSLSATFDSKETTSTAHYARLEIALGAVSSFSGPLDGDVTGGQTSTRVSRINGSPLGSLNGVGTGQVLTFLGSGWGPGNVVSSLLGGLGLSLSASNGDITIGIPLGGLTNDLLANPGFNLLTGTGLGGGGTIPLGGTLSLVNTGLLSLGALSPLSVSGGQNPSISLSGLVPVGNGGTGASSAAAALANLGGAARGANSDITSLSALSGVNANILTVLTSLPVYITPSGALGVVGSSARFKEGVVDMGDATKGLLDLRPVRFRYKQGIDAAGLEQYGLVAEEVAQVYPDLVAYDTDGQPLTVRYQALTPMLLNEVQRQARQIAEQEARLQRQAKQLDILAARLAHLEAAVPVGHGPARIADRY
jgi:hypothetical protein